MYVAYCCTTKELRGKAKDIYHRAIRACPWVKELAMMAFADLRDVMSFEDLRGIYGVLREKELRLHADLDEKLEEFEDKLTKASLSALARRRAV